MTTTEPGKILIAPSTDAIIAEIARERMDWETALGELIDNSLDAGATRVVVTIDRKVRRVRVTDNGSGCSEPHMMFVQGYSTKRGQKGVMGRYGVGLKHSSLWLCGADGVTTVVTSHNGEHQLLRVVWSELVATKTWAIDEPQALSDSEVLPILPDRRGTEVTFGDLAPGRGFPNKDQLAGVMLKLAFTFSPALRGGRQIEFRVDGKVSTLKAPTDPSWEHPVEFKVAIGKHTAHGRVGTLASNDTSGRRGISFCFGHRVIVADSGHGCDTYSTQGFAGTVVLDDNWRLGQHKSEVVDELWDQLGDAVLAHTKPILEKLSNEMRMVHSDALRIKTASVINDLLGIELGKAARPNKHGQKRKPPMNNIDRTVRTAAIVGGDGCVRGGKRKPDGGRGGLTIDWWEDRENEPPVPWAAKAEPESNRVYLNRKKEVVRSAFENNDSGMLAVIAVSHWFASLTIGKASLISAQEYGDMMGEFLSKPMSVAIVGRTASA